MNMADNDSQNDLLREVAPKKKKPSALPKIIVMLLLAGAVGLYLFPADEPAKIVDIPKVTAPAEEMAVDSESSAVQPASESESVAHAPAILIPKSEVDSAAKIIRTPGSSARAIIAKSKEAKEPVNLKQIFNSAQEFKAKSMLADAHLLYFFAARQGHSAAAQALAKMHDPAHYSKQTSVMDGPDLVQAYKWYRKAAKGDHSAARKELNNFRTQVEQMAASGNSEAKQLSLQWQ